MELDVVIEAIERGFGSYTFTGKSTRAEWIGMMERVKFEVRQATLDDPTGPTNAELATVIASAMDSGMRGTVANGPLSDLALARHIALAVAKHVEPTTAVPVPILLPPEPPREPPRDRVIEPTLNSRLSNAELCRRNGWAVGTRLVGRNGTETIEITAVGEESILAKSLSTRGPCREYSWSLHWRKWSTAETES